ncbi:MAG TPA: hypothetical protein VLH61_01000, partial [Bacteroidales bacterium]|nr:hypothetical protein [Bacteroidales bacterium]
MVQKNNTEKYFRLRKEFPCFVYENYTVNFSSTELTLGFVFRVEEKYIFNPTLRFPLHIFRKDITAKSLEIFAFHIGMVEMISYWKAFCSPKILVKPGRLNSAQERWWKKLFIHGLGEFFYTNRIEIQGDGLFEFYYSESAPIIEKSNPAHLTEGLIVPVGGGKDSVVTLELFKKSGMPV